jgi:hypothetical protein
MLGLLRLAKKLQECFKANAVMQKSLQYFFN